MSSHWNNCSGVPRVVGYSLLARSVRLQRGRSDIATLRVISRALLQPFGAVKAPILFRAAYLLIAPALNVRLGAPRHTRPCRIGICFG
jgi:hypothetical protein